MKATILIGAAGIIFVSAIMILAVRSPVWALDEVRGDIYNLSQKEITLDGATFPGFYYDMDYDTATEKLTLRLSNIESDGSVASLRDQPDAYGNRGVVYTTEAEPCDFDFGPWGQYEEIKERREI